MCSGHPPFRKGGQDDHYTAVVRRHLKAERPQLKLEIAGFDEELSDLCRRMMSRRPDVRPSFDELISKLGVISRRMGGRVPPRHQDVELIKSAATPDADRTEPPITGNDGNATGGGRTVMFAVAAGIAIGVGVSLVAIFAFK
jgi:serine/threonine-protein kinase